MAGIRSKVYSTLVFQLILALMSVGYQTASAQTQRMVRIAEIEIVPAYLEAYKAILETEAAASVKLEPGVIAIFPMYKKENTTKGGIERDGILSLTKGEKEKQVRDEIANWLQKINLLKK